jgi:hypothetical protein
LRRIRLLRLSHWLWLFPPAWLLRRLTRRNIRGAYRAKATSIASIRHSSNASGQHRASAAAPSIRVYFSQTSRAIPTRGLRAAPNPIEPDVLDATLKRCIHPDLGDLRILRGNQAITPEILLSRPAPLCKDQSPCVGCAPKQTCQFQGLVAFRTRRHQAGELQRVGREVVPIKPVKGALGVVAHLSPEPAAQDLLRPLIIRL